MSRWKNVLRILEGLTAAQIASAVLIALLVGCGVVTAASAQAFVMTNFILVFPVFLVAIVLSVELMELQRTGQSWWRRHFVPPSLGELKQLVRWCPRALFYLCLAIAAMGYVGLFMMGGEVHWSSGQEFTVHHAVGFSLNPVVFCSMSLPVLASASRMPGGFEDHFGKRIGPGT